MANQRTAGKTKTINTVILVIVLLFLLFLPIWSGGYVINTALLILLYMSLGHLWNLLGGYSGLVSLGQQAFIGLGGYSLAIISQVLSLPLYLGFIVAGVSSVLFALVISMPIFKMKGVYFTIGTWIVAECLKVFFSTWKFANYSMGFSITATYKLSPTIIYYVALAVGVCTTVLVWLLLRTKFGLGLMAMRDNEAAAEVRGVRIYWMKLQCFLIAAFMTGITGAALYLNIAYVKPDAAFGIDWTIAMAFVVIIGGIGTIEGPIIGSIIYVMLTQILHSFPGFGNLILGAICIILIIAAPKGIMGYLGERHGLEVFSVRRMKYSERRERKVLSLP